MKKQYFASLLFLVLIYGCNSSKHVCENTVVKDEIKIKSETNEAEKSTVKGKVREQITNGALPSARVVLMQDGNAKLGVLTDLEGNFQLNKVPAGKYILSVSMMGYKSAESPIEVKNGTDLTVELKLIEQTPVLLKPIIYLYPTEKTAIHVELNYKGELTHTYPNYPKNGWNVIAEPNGTLWDEKGMEYYALFWEGEQQNRLVPKDGFIVPGNKTALFLEEKLAYLGLNRREANEFIMFWLPRMENNAFNLIHFSSEEYERQAELHITPQPETTIRVMMLTQPLEKYTDFPIQDLTKLKKIRKGYTVVEWGGNVVHVLGLGI